MRALGGVGMAKPNFSASNSHTDLFDVPNSIFQCVVVLDRRHEYSSGGTSASASCGRAAALRLGRNVPRPTRAPQQNGVAIRFTSSASEGRWRHFEAERFGGLRLIHTSDPHASYYPGLQWRPKARHLAASVGLTVPGSSGRTLWSTPGAVTILPAWKLDAIYCAGLKVGSPQVSLAALRILRELLIACESRLVSADGNIVTQEAQDGSAVTTRTKNGACLQTHSPDSTTPARSRSRRRATSGAHSRCSTLFLSGAAR
jgi:hypothetical protein